MAYTIAGIDVHKRMLAVVAPRTLKPGPPAPGAARQDMGVVEQTIQEGRDGGGIAEQFAPVLDGAVRGEKRRRSFVPAHDDLEEILGGRLRQLPHREVVDDQQRDRGDVSEVGLAGAVELGVGEFVQEDVGLAVEDPMALLDDGDPDDLRQVTLPRAGPAEEEPVLPLGDEATGRELEDDGPVHLFVEVEIEGIERLAGIAEAGVLDPTFEESILALQQLVLDEGGEEVDRRLSGVAWACPTADSTFPFRSAWRTRHGRATAP